MLKPKIEMPFRTDYPLMNLVLAARNCRQSFDKMDSYTDEEYEELGPNDEKMIRQCIDSGHDSILEHSVFTFKFTCSRVCQTQLVRHRIASFAIESARCVKPDTFICPESIATNDHMRKSYLQYMEATKEFYDEMCAGGIPMEDARYVLPMATTGKIVYTSNLRSLRHAIAERTCKDAQWEIRNLFNGIKAMLKKIHPVLVYKCEKIYHNCGKKCGKCIQESNDEV